MNLSEKIHLYAVPAGPAEECGLDQDGQDPPLPPQLCSSSQETSR